MNVSSTKRFFEENEVIALKADRDASPEVDQLLVELGNTQTAIPYYAIFSPGLKEPIHFGGNVLTSSTVISEIERAIGSEEEPLEQVAARERSQAKAAIGH